MNTELNELLAEIRRLQEEVEKRWDALREQFNYTLEGHKVRFAAEMRRLHKRYKISAIKYLFSARPLVLVTSPVAYIMVLPLVLLDASFTVYQHICFRVYNVPRVRRRNFIVIDRHQLAYLNNIEKLNCVYCGYANGMIAYVEEIIARTEQYWCPIKHAQRVLGAHDHYRDFLDYGDAENYQSKLVALRKALSELEDRPKR